MADPVYKFVENDFCTCNFQETVTERWNLVCGRFNHYSRIVQMIFFVGNMIGVLLIGPYSDWYGRKIAYMTALTIWSIVTVAGYLTNNPYLWLITRFLAGAASLAYNTAADVYRYVLKEECITYLRY